MDSENSVNSFEKKDRASSYLLDNFFVLLH